MGGAQQGNRFVPFVRAYARPNGIGSQIVLVALFVFCPRDPFSLFAVGSSQTKAPKRKFPSESSQNESSQAKVPKMNSKLPEATEAPERPKETLMICMYIYIYLWV